MSRKLVWVTTLAVATFVLLAGSAQAQYRGYGSAYDAGPGYFENSPAYDPFYNEQGGQYYSSPRRVRPQAYGYDPAPGYGRGPGYDQGPPPEPPYADQRDGGQGAGAPGGDRDLGENANRRTMVEVANPTKQPAGTIVIDTASRHLYLVENDGQALQYGIGVGRQGFSWKGVAKVERKAEWPDWIPPSDMLKRRPDLPLRMEGGIENPLGARALYLFQGNRDTLFRIHGTNEPDTIGQAVSSGCIRMMNADVIDLYQRVPVGTRVVVL